MSSYCAVLLGKVAITEKGRLIGLWVPCRKHQPKYETIEPLFIDRPTGSCSHGVRVANSVIRPFHCLVIWEIGCLYWVEGFQGHPVYSIVHDST